MHRQRCRQYPPPGCLASAVPAASSPPATTNRTWASAMRRLSIRRSMAGGAPRSLAATSTGTAAPPCARTGTMRATPASAGRAEGEERHRLRHTVQGWPEDREAGQGQGRDRPEHQRVAGGPPRPGGLGGSEPNASRAYSELAVCHFISVSRTAFTWQSANATF